jgi:CitMHS family citrate-Mg2+:H+ or citrate-Ca2+:H+ symporter
LANELQESEYLKVSKETVAQLTPLIATTAVVGMLIQVMSFNGVKVDLNVDCYGSSGYSLDTPSLHNTDIGRSPYIWWCDGNEGIPLIWMLNSNGKTR